MNPACVDSVGTGCYCRSCEKESNEVINASPWTIQQAGHKCSRPGEQSGQRDTKPALALSGDFLQALLKRGWGSRARQGPTRYQDPKSSAPYLSPHPINPALYELPVTGARCNLFLTAGVWAVSGCPLFPAAPPWKATQPQDRKGHEDPERGSQVQVERAGGCPGGLSTLDPSCPPPRAQALPPHQL